MPIEIKELHIKAVINEGADNSAPASPASSDSNDERDDIISECVEKVLEILRQERER